MAHRDLENSGLADMFNESSEEMKHNDRLNWKIEKKFAWVAEHLPTSEVLVAQSKSELMSKVNDYRKALQ